MAISQPAHPGDRRDVGVAGLGRMGLPIALALLRADLRVGGNRRHEPPQAFLDGGGHSYVSPAKLAADCPVVLTVMPGADALTSVVTGSDGLASTDRRDGVWVEMSTVPPPVKRQLADRMAEKGWTTLDCPISGAPAQLQNGQAVLLSSGERDTHERVKPLLQAISEHVSYVGAFGAGMHAKYTAYLLLAGHSMIAAEALAFARAAGLDLADILAALAGTIVSSAVFDQRAPCVLDPLDTAATGNLGPLIDTLTQLDQFAPDLHARTPVLDQITRHLDHRYTSATDELVVAFYQQLTAAAADDEAATTDEEQ